MIVITFFTEKGAWALPESLKFTHLMQGEESVGEVLAFHLDQYGFMWIGGKLGLSRYDGVSFQFFRHDPDDPTSISSNTVNDIVADPTGQIWIATTNGLNRFDFSTETFTRFYHREGDANTLSSNLIYKIRIDEQQNFWLTTREGLNRYDFETHQFIRYPLDGKNPDLYTAYTMDIASDGEGRLFIGTGYGLKIWEPSSDIVKFYQRDSSKENTLPVDLIRAIFVDSKKRVWVGTEKGLVLFDPDDEIFQLILTDNDPLESTRSDAIWDIIEDNKGTIWVAFDGQGIAYFNEDQYLLISSTHDPQNSNSISASEVRRLYENNLGDIWAGTFPSGISIFERHSAAFDVIKASQNRLSQTKVRSLFEDSLNRIWIGTDGGGLNIYDPNTNQYTWIKHNKDNKNSLSSDDIMTITEDSQKNYWIGTWATGLNVYDETTGSFRHYDADPNDPFALSNTHTWKTLETSDKSIWVATIGSGLNKYIPEKDGFISYIHSKDDNTSIADDLIWALVEDSYSNLWIGTENGLSRLKLGENSFTNFLNDPADPKSLSANRILSLFIDSKNRLWVGTHGGGVNLYDGESGFKSITVEDGLISNVVNAIVEDNLGNIWLSSEKGLSSYYPESGNVSVFNHNDGIQKGEFNIGSALKIQSGDLLFGGTNGITRFNPLNIRTNEYAAPVVVSELSVLNQRVEIGSGESIIQKAPYLTSGITLNHQQDFFSIIYRSLNFRSPHKNQYAYKLEGFNDKWRFVGNETKASYTNLDPGIYTFKVKAANNDGLWNDKATQLKITVLPPLWKTWWAYCFYVISIVTLIWAYTFNLRKVNRVLEEKVRARTKDLEETNQKLEDLIVSDSLTMLGNRRLLEKTIESDTLATVRQYDSWLESESVNPPSKNDLIFYIIDIDHFKRINDTYGHSSGDKILIEFADVLRKLSRESDHIIRWGGEEFIIITKFSERKNAEKLADRLLKRVREHQFQLNSNQVVSITCSLGFACYPLNIHAPGHYSWEQMINIADMALYAAKHSGRDCWVGIESTQVLAEDFEQIKEARRQGKLNFVTSLETQEIKWA